MFFETWWQGLIFGGITSIGLLAVAQALSIMWRKYESVEEDTAAHGCDAQPHH